MTTEPGHQNAKNQTTRARGQLYVLIAQFRKEAQQTTDPEVSSLFATSAEVIAGLARSFREYENQQDDDNGSDTGPGCLPTS